MIRKEATIKNVHLQNKNRPKAVL